MYCSRLRTLGFCLVFALIMIALLPNTAVAAPKDEVESISAEAELAAQGAFQKSYGISAAVHWNDQQKSLKDLARIEIPLQEFSSRKTASKDSAAEVTKDFIRKHSSELGVVPEQLGAAKVLEARISNDPSATGGLIISHILQRYKGLPVIGSNITAVFKGGDLVRYKSSFQGGLDISIMSKISESEAARAAIEYERKPRPLFSSLRGYALKQRLTDRDRRMLEKRDPEVRKSELVILPQLGGARLSWRITYRKPFSHLVHFVDAANGEVKRRDDLRLADFEGHQSGYYYPSDPDVSRHGPVALRGFAALEPENPSSWQECDESGNYSIDVPSWTTSSITYDLPIFVQISDEAVDSATAFTIPPVTAPMTIDVDWGEQDTTYKQQASNLTYHIELAKQFFRNPDRPFYIPAPGQEWKILTIIDDEDSECNAFAGVIEPDNPYQVMDPTKGIMIFGAAGNMCEASSLYATTIHHEFGHLVVAYVYDPDYLLPTGEERAINEAFADFISAIMNNDSQMMKQYPPEMRNLDNNLQYGFYPDGDMAPYEDLGDCYDNSRILSGALWSFREAMIEEDFFDGAENAENLFMAGLLTRPETFEEAMEALSLADTGDSFTAQICDGFYWQHGILSPYVDCPEEPGGGDDPGGGSSQGEPPPRDEPGLYYPFDGQIVDNSGATPVVATIEDDNLENWILDRRQNGFDWEIITGGTQGGEGEQIGTMEPSELKNGCFYQYRLRVASSSGLDTYTSWVKKEAGFGDQMPRMVCVYRTGHEGAENDACELIAIVSDPKPAYYQMSEDDWRRGRSHLLQGRDHYQFWNNDGIGMCDPDNHWQGFPHNDYNCAGDCWNIAGTNGNHSGGNDGLDDVFCARWANCSTTSFSGCESRDQTCWLSAVYSLKNAYHKVAFFHWSNSNGTYRNCSDDGGFQKYLKMAGGTCSEPRCLWSEPDDSLHRFHELWSFHPQHVTRFYSSDFAEISREFEQPVQNCHLCGCPETVPYCEPDYNTCQQKCHDGTWFGSCRVANDNIVYCDNGTLLNGCNRSECAEFTCPNERFCNNDTGSCDYCIEGECHVHQGTLKYCQGGELVDACGRSECAGVACPDGKVCDTDTNVCIECLTNADCDDGNGCTYDRCKSNNYCENTWIENDCSELLALGHQCGASPSGCWSCKCDSCAYECDSNTGELNRCVSNNECMREKFRTKCPECIALIPQEEPYYSFD